MIALKTDEDIQGIAASGKIASLVIRKIQEFVRPGIRTCDIDKLAQEIISQEGAISAFKDYNGFPAHICTSINEEIVHGIPSDRILQDGDILSVDVGVILEGYYSDAAVTFGVGKISADLRRLLAVTKSSLSEGVKKARAGNYLSDISYAIQSYVEKHNLSVVREFVGHGVGFKLHEEPEIPNFGKPGCGPKLTEGMVLAIEPMVNIGTWQAVLSENGWTARTKDGKPSAHFEHTIAITKEGPRIITR